MTELRTRRASVSANSYNSETRTFTAVAATGTPVPRTDDFDGGYDEVLAITSKAIRLARFASGRAPLLNAHRKGEVTDQIGVVTAVRIEGGKLVVDCQLSRRPDVEPIAADLAAGVLRNVSVGYRVIASEESTPANGQRSTITHVDWEPYELSLVPLPADPNAYIRSAGASRMEPENLDYNDDSNDLGGVVDRDPPQRTRRAPVDMQTRAERNRVNTILDVGQRAKLSDDVVQRAIAEGMSVDSFRALAFDEMAERSARVQTGMAARMRAGFDPDGIGYSSGGDTFDNPGFMGRAIEEALYARMSGTAPTFEPARRFMGKRLLDIGADLLQSRGVRVDHSRPDQIASGMLSRDAGGGGWVSNWFSRSGSVGGGMNTTSDFPVLLGNVMNRRLLDLFRAAESGASKIAAPGTVADFRPQREGRMTSFPALEKIKEHGEIHFGSLSEEGEQLAIGSYAKGINVSFQLLVNDDLGAITRSIQDIGFATAELKARLIIAALTASLSDGNTVFHSAHGNLAASGAGISVATVSDGRLAMRNQTAVDKTTKLGISPKFILVPNELETAADSLVAPINPTQLSAVNPFAAKLEVAVEPRLTSATAWHLFADPALYPVIRFLTLQGFEGPRLEVEQAFEKLGTSYRVTWHCGAGPVDYRGAYKNGGA